MLYEPPRPSKQPPRGRPPKKGALLGSPKTLARKRRGWQPHPTEAGTLVQAREGLWHAVLPGCLLRVVVVRRPAPNRKRKRKRKRKRGQRQPLPRIEAFFTTDLSLSLAAILEQYRDRWAVEITLRDSYAFDGVGQDQCRKVERIVGANTCRVVLAAARTLWFLDSVSQTAGLPLTRYRPWYRQKCAPSQRDIVWACREALADAGVFPIPHFAPVVIENPAEPENTLL